MIDNIEFSTQSWFNSLTHRRLGRNALGLSFLGLVLAMEATMPHYSAAQVTTNNALPIGEGQALIRGQAIYLRADDGDRELEEFSFPFVFGYGATQDLAFFAVVPFLRRSLEVEGLERNEFGLGDIEFLARYTVFQINQAGKTFRIAPIVGLEVPTGTDQSSDGLGVLPPPLQLGSGTFDPSVGVVLTRQTLKDNLSASLVYQVNTEANDVNFGDEASIDLAYKYRIFPDSIETGFLFAGLESNLSVQNRDRVSGIADGNSGGTLLFLSPSIQYITERFNLEGAIQIPVVQALNGTALAPDIRLIIGAQVNF